MDISFADVAGVVLVVTCCIVILMMAYAGFIKD